MLKRVGLMLINIVFPPLGILLLCGPESDMIINCVLFILAVIPSHIHAFYISMTYFHRKSKVRKGQWPGPWKSFIYSEKVQNGGASASQVRKLKQAQQPEGTGEKLCWEGRDDEREDTVKKLKYEVERGGEAEEPEELQRESERAGNSAADHEREVDILR